MRRDCMSPVVGLPFSRARASGIVINLRDNRPIVLPSIIGKR